VIRVDPSQILLAWILVFREITIYALRAIDPDRKATMSKLRWLSVSQAIVIRAYFGTFILNSFLGATGTGPPTWLALYPILGIAAAIVGYTSICLHAIGLIDRATSR